MKNYKIYLLRHGATQGNQEGKYIGSTDLPLSDAGVTELKNLAQTREYPRVQVVYTSPMQRCVQTADILYPDTAVEYIDLLREYDFGAFENRTMQELKDDADFQAWMGNQDGAVPPGGEDRAAFHSRICLGLGIVRDMMARSLTAAAVITHGGVIMSLMAEYGLPKRNPMTWHTDNGCGYTLVTSSYLWGNANAFEIMDRIPYPLQEADGDFYRDYDLIEIEEEHDE